MAVPLHTDHVGSLLRPPELLESRRAYSEGRLTADELHACEDRCVLEALEQQRRHSVEIFSDGEFRRVNFISNFRDAVNGLVTIEQAAPPAWKGRGGALVAERGTTVLPQVVGAKLSMRDRIAGRDAAFLRQHAPGPYKVTLPSPGQAMSLYRPGISDTVYPTPADLLADLVILHRNEVQALAEEGVPYIQLDSLRYIDAIDADRRARARATGVDLDQVVDETIAADNAVLRAGRRPGVTLAMHICRGNNRSAWLAEGSYEPVAEKLFGQLEVDRFLLEYDTERAGGFEPLRFVPRGKRVVLGLISSKEPQPESVDDLRRRIDEAARYVPLDELAISPQCGFASSMLGNLLTPDEQWRKLELVAETARLVWNS